MTDENNDKKNESPMPTTSSSSTVGETIQNIIKSINLPELIAGPAGKALSRLIGGAADIPAAWLEQRAQAIRDQTEARTRFRKAVADHAIAKLPADPELLERAGHSLLGREMRAQANKEAVGELTVSYLAKISQEHPEEKLAPEAPSEEWMSAFERVAADASSDGLRETWARILAGEITSPSSFSLKTLRTISEIDRDTAAAFEKLAQHVFNGRFFPRFAQPVLSADDYSLLADADLVVRSTGFNENISGDLNLGFEYYNGFGVVLVGSGNITITVGQLTRAGRELLTILDLPNPLIPAQIFAERIARPHELQQVVYGRVIREQVQPGDRAERISIVGVETILWERTG